MHLHQIIGRLEPEVSSSEIFAALFEFEIAARVKQLPDKNFVKAS
jgi:DNA processing protein